MKHLSYLRYSTCLLVLALLTSLNTISQQEWVELNTSSEFLSNNERPIIKVMDDGRPVVAYRTSQGYPRVKIWNPNTTSWDLLPPPVGTSTDVYNNIDIEISGNNIYFGGSTNITNYYYYVRKFNFNTNSWTTLSLVPYTHYQEGTMDLFANRDSEDIYLACVSVNGNAAVKRFAFGSFTPLAGTSASYGELIPNQEIDKIKGYYNENGELYVLFRTNYGGFSEDFRLFKYNFGASNFEHVEDLYDDNGNENIEFFDIDGDRIDAPVITWNLGLGGGTPYDTLYAARPNATYTGFENYIKRSEFFDVTSLASGAIAGVEYFLHAEDSQTSNNIQLHRTPSSSSSWSMVGSNLSNSEARYVDVDFNRYSKKPYVIYQYQSGLDYINYVETFNNAPNVDDFNTPKKVCKDASNAIALDYLFILDDDHDSVYVSSVSSSDQSIIENANIQVVYQGTYGPSTSGFNYKVYVTPESGVTGITTLTISFTDGISTPVSHVFDVEVITPNPNFTQSTYETCLSNNPVTIMNNVIPQGGVFSGPGIFNNKFHSSLAGVGTHTITYTYTNSNGCSAQTTATVEVLPKPSITTTIANVSCTGGDGAVDATVTGGTPGYTMYWSSGATTEDIQDLHAGVYYLTVTDDNGCQAMKMANVSSDVFTLSASITDVTCFGGNDGNIDVTVNGTSGPYDIEWLNNGSTDEDATNIVAGTWEIYVEDANGCVVSELYEVNEPDDITWVASTIEATCGSSNGSAQCLVAGGTAPYDFQWFDDGGNSVGINDDELTGITGGEYSVLITDDHGCSKLWNTIVTEVGGPQVTLDTVIHASCAGDGAIDISISSTNPIVSQTWNNGAVTEDLSSLAPGYYAIEVVDNAGCTGMLGVNVTNSQPEVQEICMVTVDTSTITNQVIWTKPVTTNISHYNIYRETSTAGQYQFVDSVLYADESWFTDTIAYPHIRSWRYKISAVNNCGIESDLSLSHKTIHVTKNLALGGGVNVSWDQYEGFTYPTYFVNRHTDVNGWEVIAQVSSASSTSYLDFPPSNVELDYFIGIEPSVPCVSEKATSHNASRSNRSNSIAGPSGGGNTDGLGLEDIKIASLRLYPNPTTGIVNIEWSATQKGALYTIIDAAGKVVRQWESNKQIELININNLEDGMYIITVENEELKNQYRVVKQ